MLLQLSYWKAFLHILNRVFIFFEEIVAAPSIEG